MQLPKLSRFNTEWRLAALKNGFQDATVYRWEFLLEIIGSAMVPALVQWILWYALFKIGGHELIAGQTYSQMLLYTGVSLLFTQIRGGDHDFALAEMIRDGSLSQYLLRPVGVVEFVYLRGVAPKFFIAGFCFLIGIITATAMGMPLWNLPGAMLMALLGNVIHYQLGAILAATAFLWEESYAILMVKNMIVAILCGEMIPLTLFPESLSWVWKSTPFYLYVFGPTQFALGKWSLNEYFYHMGIGVLWLLGLTLLIQISWRLGTKRYQSLGG